MTSSEHHQTAETSTSSDLRPMKKRGLLPFTNERNVGTMRKDPKYEYQDNMTNGADATCDWLTRRARRIRIWEMDG